MKKQILKSALIASMIIGPLSGSALAAPIATGPWTEYEYFQKTTNDPNGFPGQLVENNQQLNFFFDLAFIGFADFENPYQLTGTDSQLSLKNDVAGYGQLYGTKPVKNIWSAITLFSTDNEWEQFNIDVTAFVGANKTYKLTEQAFTLGTNENSDTATIIIKWSGDLLDAWKLDPYGIVNLELTMYNPSGGYNDFNLLEVGTGVSPIPEPATMLLFGAGMAGLTGMARRRRTT